jgi:hypothetical protein
MKLKYPEIIKRIYSGRSQTYNRKEEGMKRNIIGLMMGMMVVTLACGLIAPTAAPAQSGVETIVAATLQALTVAPGVDLTPSAEGPTPATQTGVTVSANGVNFLIPIGLGTGAQAELIPEVTEQTGAPWEIAPAFSKFTLQGYPLQGKFFEPQILVYPAQEFETASAGATQSLQKLRAILAIPSAPLTEDSIPGIPTFNAGQVFISNMQVVSFQNGSGVRVLTQYAQYFAPANNLELIYQFQGLTGDGKYYVIAILPVNASFLPVDDKPDAVIPIDGVPFPANGPDESYYIAVKQKLNGTSPEAFIPSVTALDALIQSITITP